MSNVNEAVIAYIAAWNERDPDQRRAVVAKAWVEDGSYVDAHRAGSGHAAIDEMIGQVQSALPGYTIRLASGIEAHNNRVRFSWATGGTPEAPLFFAGTDFAEIAPDGRFLSVTGFIDAVPSH